MCILPYSLFTVACFNGGTCTNIPGAFSCECPDGVFGDACEFVHENCECPPNYECLEVEGTPSQCISLSAGGLMMVQDPVPQNTAVLDQTINTLNEDQPVSGKKSITCILFSLSLCYTQA